jgi:hypothetical protein
MITKLIPQKDGTGRPMLLFRAVLRIWSRCRQGPIRQWEAEYTSGHAFNTSTGRRIGDELCRHLMKVDAGQAQQLEAAEVLFNLQKLAKQLIVTTPCSSPKS